MRRRLQDTHTTVGSSRSWPRGISCAGSTGDWVVSGTRKGRAGVLLETPRSNCSRNGDSEKKRTCQVCWPASTKGEQKDALQGTDSLQGNSPAFISSTSRTKKRKAKPGTGRYEIQGLQHKVKKLCKYHRPRREWKWK